MKKWLLVAAGTGLLAIGVLGVPSSLLYAFILPETYRSVARVKIEQPSNPKTDTRAAWTPDWVATGAEVVLSERVLTNVAATLLLGRRWGERFRESADLHPGVVQALLKHQVEVRRVGKTALLEIRVMSEDRNEAATIANEIARVYCEQRAVDAQRQTDTDNPNPAPATVIDRAQPAFRPAHSKLRLMLPGLGVCALLIACGSVLLFLASRFSRPTGANA